MGTSLIIIAIAVGSTGAMVSPSTAQKQNKIFQQYWGTDFSWKFDELPEKAVVDTFRVPYSGHIYPDTAGGTSSALRKYDYAFHGGRMVATGHEQWDTTAFKEREPRRGLLGRLGVTSMQTPNWYGHCNGWTAAAIRHAEPQTSVTRNGVTFRPTDIKALLAEIYLYNDTKNLTEPDYRVNPGEFHAIIGNWIGRGLHPIGMEGDPGEEKWNYPVYAYSTSSAKRGDRLVEVKMNIAYAKDSNGEYQESPRIRRIRYFHYSLTLNSNGEIVGGQWYRDTSSIDFFWIPLRPKASRAPGNERGNPYVNVDQVLAIWRDSVPADVRQKWLVIDPSPADRVLDTADVETLVPLQTPLTPPSGQPADGPGNDEVADTESAAPEAADDADAGEPAVAAAEDVAADETDTADPEPTEADLAEAETVDAETTETESTETESTETETPEIAEAEDTETETADTSEPETSEVAEAEDVDLELAAPEVADADAGDEELDDSQPAAEVADADANDAGADDTTVE